MGVVRYNDWQKFMMQRLHYQTWVACQDGSSWLFLAMVIKLNNGLIRRYVPFPPAKMLQDIMRQVLKIKLL